MHRFEDSKEVRHAIQISARSLYEAVEMAVPALRDLGWSEDIDEAAELRVEVQSPTVVHTIERSKLSHWVEAPGGRGAREVILKENLKKAAAVV